MMQITEWCQSESAVQVTGENAHVLIVQTMFDYNDDNFCVLEIVSYSTKVRLYQSVFHPMKDRSPS